MKNFLEGCLISIITIEIVMIIHIIMSATRSLAIIMPYSMYVFVVTVIVICSGGIFNWYLKKIMK
ncbi:hypothetical protein [Clostridium sp.]|uniref:hypothetical protein n=1 Tax=Clostridium sp. TaxID=1506 RepID=UPI003F3F8CC9